MTLTGGCGGCLQALVSGVPRGGLKRLRKAAGADEAADTKRGRAEADAAELMDDIPSPGQASTRQHSHATCIASCICTPGVHIYCVLLVLANSEGNSSVGTQLFQGTPRRMQVGTEW